MRFVTISIVALLGLGPIIAVAGNYEILYDVRNASGWFGGDDRPEFGPRNVGAGQSVFIDTDILLEDFSFYFTHRFDYSGSPSHTGHAVTLTLHVRNVAGEILTAAVLDLPASFNGGWATWTGIDLGVAAGTTLVFTSFVNDAYYNDLSTGQAGDHLAGYFEGIRYTKTGSTDASMAQWDRWNPHIWDSAFRLRGTTGGSGVPDLTRSMVTSAYTGPGTVVLYNRPDGLGASFKAARNLAGWQDATVTLTLRDVFSNPIANYPAEDLWLESADGGVVSCVGGTIADDNTDSAGQTSWEDPLHAGGASEEPTILIVAGAALVGAGLPITYNSADVNGDGIVNLSDVVTLAGDFYAGYTFRADLYFDGAVNLLDVVVLAEAIGIDCP